MSDRLAVLGDREAQVGLLARAGAAGVEAHVVAAVAHRGRRRGGQRREVGGAVDAQVGGQRLRLAVVREVGEQPVGAGVVEAHRRRPGAVGRLLGVQVLEAGQVAAGDDQVHALRVLDVEVAHRLAALVDDPEGEPLGRPRRSSGSSTTTRRPSSATASPRTGSRGGVLGLAGGHLGVLLGFGRVAGSGPIAAPASAPPPNSTASTPANAASLAAALMPSPWRTKCHARSSIRGGGIA